MEVTWVPELGSRVVDDLSMDVWDSFTSNTRLRLFQFLFWLCLRYTLSDINGVYNINSCRPWLCQIVFCCAPSFLQTQRFLNWLNHLWIILQYMGCRSKFHRFKYRTRFFKVEIGFLWHSILIGPNHNVSGNMRNLNIGHGFTI